jgi:hypothetical protein
MARVWMFALIAVLALHAFGAQPDAAPWSKVLQLRSGQALRVLSSDQRTRTGRLAEVSDDALVLNVGGAEQKIARSDVRRVDVKSRTRSVLIGLGIGAAAGVGIGYAAGSQSNLKSDEKSTAAGLGAAIFAGAGAGLGALVPSWKTVYRGGVVPPTKQ